ncbi:hypothetical protein K402DRAFT_436921 [Aulographum hederae CBS 113979]|uniref:Uncharacterized protein n=1 Tax=Aulographum hederae CBS 113979 TaxID=1176131 RepID=A0A6G1GQI7_9PEZI|nr:hypothetical protein K402DRAFT_436921 [Aulographum hederae CBS 113979]
MALPTIVEGRPLSLVFRDAIIDLETRQVPREVLQLQDAHLTTRSLPTRRDNIEEHERRLEQTDFMVVSSPSLVYVNQNLSVCLRATHEPLFQLQEANDLLGSYTHDEVLQLHREQIDKRVHGPKKPNIKKASEQFVAQAPFAKDWQALMDKVYAGEPENLKYAIKAWAAPLIKFVKRRKEKKQAKDGDADVGNPDNTDNASNASNAGTELTATDADSEAGMAVGVVENESQQSLMRMFS